MVGEKSPCIRVIFGLSALKTAKIGARSRGNMIWEENWGDFVIFLGLKAEIEGKSVTYGAWGASK